MAARSESTGSSQDHEKVSSLAPGPTELATTTSVTGTKEPVGTTQSTPAQAAAKLAADAPRARYLLVLDHSVADDVIENVITLLQTHGLNCELIAGSDGERYILVTAEFKVLAAQVIKK